MKFIKLVKSAKTEGTKVSFESLAGSIEIALYNDNDIRLGLWSGGKVNERYHKDGEENYEQQVEDAKAILPELEQICSEFDSKIIAMMEKHGYKQKSN